MEIVAVIIMLMVILSLVLKLTYLPVGARLVICLICAAFTGLSWESAAAQSKTQIADWLQNPGLMLDIAVLLTVDVFIQVSFCILNARYISGERMAATARIVRLATLWMPGILIFPTLSAMLVEVIFSFPGADFATLAWSVAAVVFVAAASLPAIVRRIVPEDDLRLELIFLVNAMTALLGVVATVNGRTAVAGTDSVEWLPLAGVVVLLLLGASAGFFLFRHKDSKKISHIR